MPTSDEMVSVLIPRSLLAKVYGLVIQHEDEAQHEETDDEHQLGPDEALIKRMYSESEPRHRQLMKLLADHPDEWLYTNEVAEALQLPHGSKSAAGMFGAFGRRASHRYDGAKPWGTEWDPAAYEARHKMTADIARIVHSL